MKQDFKAISEMLKPGQLAGQEVTFPIQKHMKQFRKFCIALGFKTQGINRKTVMIAGDSDAYGRLAAKW